MRTYDQIYESLKESTGERFTLLELINIFKNESSWVGSPIQLVKLKELITEITGARPGNCNGCNIESMKNMVRFVTNYENDLSKRPSLPKPRPAGRMNRR